MTHHTHTQLLFTVEPFHGTHCLRQWFYSLIKAGLGLSPDDPLDEASRLFQDLDLLLLLGVYPGFGGQSMQPGILEKIESVRKYTDQTNRRIPIAVDGGIKPENAVSLVQAGADILIMGTALFRTINMTETVRSIRESLAGSQHH